MNGICREILLSIFPLTPLVVSGLIHVIDSNKSSVFAGLGARAHALARGLSEAMLRSEGNDSVGSVCCKALMPIM